MPARTQLGSIPLVIVSNRLLAKGHELAATMLHTRECGMAPHPLGHRRRGESHLIDGGNPFGRNDGNETLPRVVRMPLGINQGIGSRGSVNRSIRLLRLGHMQQCRSTPQYQGQREDKQMFHKTFHTANIHKKRELRQIQALFFHRAPNRGTSSTPSGSAPPLTTNGERDKPQYLYHAIVPPRGER